MTLSNIKLPLWALQQANASYLDRRIAGFEQHHGHRPDDDSTLAEWWDATHAQEERLRDVSHRRALLWVVVERLWDVSVALPLAYPGHRHALHRAVVEVAYLAACRAQARATDRSAAAGAAALAVVRRWLGGEHVSLDDLRNNADAAGAAACTYTRAGTHNYVIYVAESAARAAAAAADPTWRGLHWPVCAQALGRAAVFACVRPGAAWTRCAAFDAESAQQRADLDRLLLALNLEGP